MLINRRFNSDDEQWAPVSDLMAVIMLIFMLIAMILFVNFKLNQRNHEEKCAASKLMLENEFKNDFSEWGAVLDKDLTIRFTNQNVLFAAGSSEVNSRFAQMLRDFFPRYMEVIREIRTTSKPEDEEILAIRIEGHTSSEHYSPGPEGAFIKNMELSQDRARMILYYVLDKNRVPESVEYDKMAREFITANGLSSSRLICDENGRENKKASRRVEFKLLTRSCQHAGVYDKVAKQGIC